MAVQCWLGVETIGMSTEPVPSRSPVQRSRSIAKQGDLLPILRSSPIPGVEEAERGAADAPSLPCLDLAAEDIERLRRVSMAQVAGSLRQKSSKSRDSHVRAF